MQYISFNQGAAQLSGYASQLAQLPAGTIVTAWHGNDDATQSLLDACAAQGKRLMIQCDDWPTQRSPAWVARFLATHAKHAAFAGMYCDEPGLKRQTAEQYANFIRRVRGAGVRTMAVFGQFGELSSNFAGLADVEGVDNYWDDPSRPKTRDEGWSEYTQFVDALMSAHARTGYAGEYVSVVTAYAQPAASWHAVAADMRRTRDYLAAKVGQRLTHTMLYASTIDAVTRGYFVDEPTFAEVLSFVNTPAPAPDDMTVHVPRGVKRVTLVME